MNFGLFNIIRNKFRKNDDQDMIEVPPEVDNNKPSILMERFEYSDAGTFGRIFIAFYGMNYQLFGYTVERQWNNNERFISCIPDYSDYELIWYDSPKFGRTLAVVGGTVSLYEDSAYQRYGILYHVGNFPENFKGCIGIGETYGTINNRKAVTKTAKTINRFLTMMEDYNNIPLVIKPKENVIGTATL